MSAISFTPNLQQIPLVVPFFDEPTNTFSYVVQDPTSKACAIIDSVMEIDYAAGHLDLQGADKIIHYIREQQLDLQWIIETHVHADHLSAAPYIQEKIGGKIGIGEHIITVQETFGKIFNEGSQFQRDGSQFDQLFKDGDQYAVGNLQCHALHTPGHTPACMTHIMGDAAFVGDTLFMPDGGSARADFPGGDARVLYQSIQRLLSLPDELRLFMCHDYMPNGRDVEYETTVKQQREHNIHVHSGISEDAFVAMREKRDATLGMPRLIIPSLQINMRAGHLPEADSNGTVYLKVPLDTL
ncbi:glyoxylase-like metal-dependent hydrolase (beta-lactamase superfamily II) [Zhongshania antarctica]|uniref:Glyoxylase-like metal-dependent hydrolase (Beta-lactamase superfamily II) n=1 Tax=Zhongshania antarctica TaxID=641702 RepID=A0A840R0V6_9GAMM|nr:MBL fold metallo-hydrolase [Zhongshania antarctica]MBB5186739.1 glyoxylase-like metal-dependent hydrolase (beta-lactamase superfamily II) [Zhongshania antarctica]